MSGTAGASAAVAAVTAVALPAVTAVTLPAQPGWRRQAANFVVFQWAWFGAVLGAAHGWPLAGMAGLLAAIGWHLAVSARPVAELRLVALVAAIGCVAETLVVAQGHIVYPSGQPLAGLPPYWIVGLWGLLAIALNVSLRWLRSRPLLAVVVGAVAGPLSFMGRRAAGRGALRRQARCAADAGAAVGRAAAAAGVAGAPARRRHVAVAAGAGQRMSPDLHTLLPPALTGLALVGLLALATWAVSLLRHDASLVDRLWPVFIATAAVTDFVLLGASGTRAGWMLALVLAWALRLCIYITRRNWGHGEDRRYQQIRARNQPHFGIKSLVLVFALQTVLACTVALPFLPGLAAAAPLNALDVAGIALALLGIGYEAVADAQMARFKADPAHRGQVMDRGLWRHSRHPNYFGEACTWWGLWLLAVGGGGWAAAWTVVSPLLMTVLLLKVSGVTLLEHDIAERRPAYRDYIRRTPAFVPGPLRTPSDGGGADPASKGPAR